MKYAKSNMNGWDENDSRWAGTYWKSYKRYHKAQKRFFDWFVEINVRNWAEGLGFTVKQMREAMYRAWDVAPFRFGIHGVSMYKNERKRFYAARNRFLKVMKNEVQKIEIPY